MVTLRGPPPPLLPSRIYKQPHRTDVHLPSGVHGGTRVFPAAFGLRVSPNHGTSSGGATAQAALSLALLALATLGVSGSER